ncbi:MAG: tetratricopeptide repeat protein, partial [Candidatus Zixiibacteriota bacterium]
MKILITISIIALLLIGISGCGGAKSVPGIMERPIKAEAGPPRQQLNPRAFDYYSAGSILDMMGEFYLANEQYGKALKYYPGSDEIRYSYANSFFNLRDYENALTEAKKVSHRDLRTWYLMANCYRALRNADSALAAYYKVIEFDSNNAQAYYQISNYYREAGNLDSTIWGFENIARINPTPLVFQQLGNMYIQGGNIEKAEENYKYSLALDNSKDNIQSYMGLSVIYESRGDVAAAKKMLEPASALAPEDMRLQGRLLDLYVADEEYLEGIRVAHRILSVMPDDDFITRRLAMMYFDVDSLQVADSIFTSLIERGDNNIVNYYYAGRIAL